MQKKYSLFFLQFLLLFACVASIPLSQNFTEKEYNAHPLIWQIMSDQNGKLWMANNDGVLRFDGSNWSLLPTPKPVRSMAFDPKGNLFLACEGDLAVFRFNKKGMVEYYSFRDQLGNAKQASNGDKKVLIIKDEVYFISGENIFKVIETEKGFEIKIKQVGEIGGAFILENKLYVNLINKGLGIFSNNTWQLIPHGEIFKGKNIIGSTKSKNGLIIGTNFDGLFLYKDKKIQAFTGSIQNFSLKGLYAISSNLNGDIALGTISNGVQVFNGNKQLKQELNLPSNEIYDLFYDQENNLWTAHRKGLSHHKLSAPIWMYPEFETNGFVTDIYPISVNKFLLSSTTGLYLANALGNNNTLNRVAGITSECWAISDKFIATTNGLLNHEGKTIIPNDVFLHLQKSRKKPNLTFAFSADACYLLEGENYRKIEGFNEMANSIYENEDGSYFIGTNHNGLLKFPYKNFNQNELPLDLSNSEVIIREFNGQAIFQTKKGTYILKNNTFTLSENLSKIFTGNTDKELSPKSTFWTIINNKLQYFKNNQVVPSFAYSLSGKPTALRQINNDLWLALENQIAKITLLEPISQNYFCAISRIYDSKGNTLFETGNQKDFEIPNFTFENNSISIEFGITSFENSSNNKYRYKINHDPNGFSNWQNEGKIVLNQLNPGNYNIEIESQNSMGIPAPKIEFNFSIQAPWYLTMYAYLLYACLLVLILFGIIRWNSKTLLAKNQKLEKMVGERTKQLEQNNLELSYEKKKSDDLLLNILPEEIAEELKTKGSSEAKLYNHVTVLFTDFVNFTGISQQLNPTELVQEIHKNFTKFDAIIEKHGLEKIKTIGDAYLAVCGLPNENSNHAAKVIDAALDIQKFTKETNSKFQVRIGIHSGPVVAGIVGVKKYAYDIWGDTVNTAARIEQNSVEGKINISQETFDLIQKQYICEYRGKINAKNKGEINMYFVEGKKAKN